MNAELPASEQVRHLLESIGVSCVDESRFELIAQGASGRSIIRAYGVIAVVWTHARADNSSFLEAARGLDSYGLRVPKILEAWQDSEGNGACLTEDLGKHDLLSYKEKSWPELREYYRRCFETILPLYALRPEWDLQPPFDEALYRWEQQYFCEHFLALRQGLSEGPQQDFMQLGSAIELAQDLASLPRMPLHRDLQSQNIMIHEQQAWLIDFQGMRMGRYEYDLGSLIFDPYMGLSLAQRQDLLALWEETSGVRLDRAIFCACTLQRLMQALGAYANLGYRQGKSWYLEMITPALEGIHQLASFMPEGTAKRLYETLRERGWV